MRKKILACDDDAGILDMISMGLTFSGYEVVSQQHSINIYQDIIEHKPDLIMLDLWMPLLSGDVISRQLKENPDTKHIPLIIFSASRDGAAVAQEALADKFVSKPFDFTFLLQSIAELLPG